MDLHGKRLILASNSPRRRELLAGLDVDFEIDTDINFKEDFQPDTPHMQVPVLMSEGKSLGFHRPVDAARMLRLLSGRDHQVVTAITLRSTDRMETVSDIAHVWFKDLTEEEISRYIERYKPFDKAGAYGIQEWIGYIGITHIEGSFYTIMGLPVHLVYDRLLRFL